MRHKWVYQRQNRYLCENCGQEAMKTDHSILASPCLIGDVQEFVADLENIKNMIAELEKEIALLNGEVFK